MAITRAQKKAILDELEQIFSEAGSIAFARFTGLPVNDSNQMRSDFYEKGVGYKVVKKTLIRRALEQAGFTGDMPDLPGNIAVVYSEEETAPAREIHEFAKKNSENMELVGGVFEGEFKSKEEMTEIALIPSLHELRGMFANVINSPIQGLVIALDQIKEAKEA